MALIRWFRDWLWPIALETARRWGNNDGGLLAAAMAYYAALSFFPLLLVLIAGLGFALRFSSGAQNAQKQLLELLAQNTTPVLAEHVKQILSQLSTQAPISGPVGLAMLLVGAMGIFAQLDVAFDRLWAVSAGSRGIWSAVRNALWQRLRAFLVLTGLGILIVVAFFTNVFLSAMRTFAEVLPSWVDELPLMNYGWDLLHVGATLALNAIVFTLLYKTIPKAVVYWRHAIAGGLLVALMWQLGSQALAFFVLSRNYTAYGVVGSFIAMMLWVYCASSLIFLGAQLVQVLGNPPAALKADRSA